MQAKRLPLTTRITLHSYHTLSPTLTATPPIHFIPRRPRENSSNLANSSTHGGEGQQQQPRDAITTPYPGLVQLGFSLPSAQSHSAAFPFAFPFQPAHTSDTSPSHNGTDPSANSVVAPLELIAGAFGIPKKVSRSTLPQPIAGPSSRADSAEWLSQQVGEDAYFVGAHAIGVADGVGGFCRPGSDPQTATSDKGKGKARQLDEHAEISGSALFARRLMHFCASEMASVDMDSPAWSDPTHQELTPKLAPPGHVQPTPDPPLLKVLNKAYTSTLRAPTKGAATVIFGALANVSTVSPNEASASSSSVTQEQNSTVQPDSPKPSAILHLAHLGDCLGMLVRSGKIVWRSEEMWMAFNTPYQLSSSTRDTNQQMERAIPSETRSFTLPVESDDVLLLASDGLGDNLGDATLLSVVSRVLSTTNGGPIGRRALPGLIARALCDAAYNKSILRPSEDVSPSDDIPFAARAREWGSAWPQGRGKRDDITVVVAVVAPS